MYSDAALEYWGDIFLAISLREDGIAFEQFLTNPWGYLRAAGQESAPTALENGYRPLTRRQAAVARNIEQRWIDSQRRSRNERPLPRPCLELVRA